MPMPKGHKSDRGYVTTETFEGGLSYREIAEIMTASDKRMNHSSVRNYMISALSKVAEELTCTVGVKVSDERLKEIAGDPRFQSALCGIIRDQVDRD
jgi:hypothetical protein